MKGRQKIVALVLAGALALVFRFMMEQMDMHQWEKAYERLEQTDRIALIYDKKQKEITGKEDIDQIRSILIQEDRVQDEQLKASLFKHSEGKLFTVEYFYQGNKLLTEQIYRFTPEGDEKEIYAPYTSLGGEVFFAKAKKQVFLLDFEGKILPKELEKALEKR